MKQSLGAAALAAAACLAVPATAAAHPSVYTSTANVLKPGTTTEPETQTRYVVTNHGYTMVLRETNGLTSESANAADRVKGVIGYNLIPGAWRSAPGRTFDEIMAMGGTGAQAHGTCQTPALQTEQAIKGWQEGDPFYNYVPFQSASAGLEDDPATWLATLLAQGFDTSKLATPAAAEAQCEKLPGAVYVPADTVQTTAASLAAGTLSDAITPLKTANETLTSEKTALGGQVAALTQQVASANAEVARLKLAGAPLKLRLSKVSTSGITAAVSGPPSSKVAVSVSLTAAQAKKAGLKATRIARGSVTTGADGSATATLKLTKAAKKALRRFKGSVTAEATSADRFATAKANFSR